MSSKEKVQTCLLQESAITQQEFFGHCQGKLALTLFDVYKAIDPDLFIIECMASGYECPTDGKGDHLPCYMHRELCEIQQGVWELLKRKSLQEVLMPEM